MEDKEMEQIRKNNAGANIEGEWFIPLDKQKNAVNEAYSLGQSRMKQKAIDCVPEEVILVNRIRHSDRSICLTTGFNDCREQTLKALSEL